MTQVSIYHPNVKAEAERFGITELQAWRKLNARAEILERMGAERGRLYQTTRGSK